MSGFKKLGVKGNVVHRVVLPGPTRRAGTRRAGSAGRGLRRVADDPQGSPSPPPSWGAARPQPAVVPARTEPARAEPGARERSPGEVRQGQRENELLQRRIEKLSNLLSEQEEQLRGLASRAPASESAPTRAPGAEPVLDAAAPAEGRAGEKRRAFMSKLFQANLDLRENVNRSRA